MDRLHGLPRGLCCRPSPWMPLVMNAYTALVSISPFLVSLIYDFFQLLGNTWGNSVFPHYSNPVPIPLSPTIGESRELSGYLSRCRKGKTTTHHPAVDHIHIILPKLSQHEHIRKHCHDCCPFQLWCPCLLNYRVPVKRTTATASRTVTNSNIASRRPIPPPQYCRTE